MKHLFLLGFALIYAGILYAQIPTPDKIVAGSPNLQNKLVEMALQNPELEVADHEVKIAKYNLSAAKGWWAENFSLSFNANQYSLKTIGKPATADNRFYTLYPLYNMGINIPIGGIFSKPQAVKAAREQVAIAENQRSIAQREIRSAVLTAYQNYLSSKELYTVESQLTESTYNDYLQSRQKFRNGEISVGDFNQATDRYQNALKSQISAENSFKLTQIQLEALIGASLSSVLINNASQPATDSTITR